MPGRLPDYLEENLKILFVGYNPGESAATLGHHYAGRGNQFWRLLHESGLTKRLYRPDEDGLLTEGGYGLTNLVDRSSKSSSDLTAEEMRAGAEKLRLVISRYRPGVVCFLGKEIYRRYAGLKQGAKVDYGPVPGDGPCPGVREFVAPNTSGRSTVPYAEKLLLFTRLKDFACPQKEKRGCCKNRPRFLI